MSFMQIIEFRTSAIDEVRQIDEEWRSATAGKRTARHQLLARDRADPRRYFAVVFFDSYESAMQNSDLPETSTAADRHRILTDGRPVYHDLDIVETAADLS